MGLAEIKKQLEHIKTYPAAITHCNGVDMAYFVPTQIAELVAAVESLTAENTRLSQLLYGGRCVYCGEVVGAETLNQDLSDEVLKEHVRTCPKHPYVEVQSSLAQAREEILKVSETRDYYCEALAKETKARHEAEQRENDNLKRAQRAEDLLTSQTGRHYKALEQILLGQYTAQGCKDIAAHALAAASKEGEK